MAYRVDASALRSEISYPPKSARDLLGRAKTVAFAPPDDCLADPVASGDIRLAGGRCGTVMSALEDMAVDAGFEVVSWRALRGSEPALHYARRSGVDVMFEINSLEIRHESVGIVGSGDATFFEVDSDGLARPITVGDGVRRRCQAELARGRAADGLYLDVKVISVRDGRALWHYRWLYSRYDTSEELARYYRGGKKKGTLYTLGMILLIAGGVDVIVGLSVDNSRVTTPGLLVGLAGGGILLLDRGSGTGPEAALCRGEGVEGPTAPSPRSPGAGAGSSTSRFTFVIPGKPSVDEAVRELAQMAAVDFLSLVVAIRSLSSSSPPDPPKVLVAKRRKLRPAGTRACLDMKALWEQGRVSKQHVKKACM